MDTGSTSKNGGGFTHMIKRIWNGPEEAETEEETGKMQSERTGSPENHGPRNEIFSRDHDTESRETREGRNQGPSANQSFRQDYPRREREPERQAMQDYSDVRTDATVISKGTVITGDIKSDGDIEMYGTVTGSMNTSGKVKINGKQMGDVQGSDVDLLECMVRGNVNASEAVTVDSGSIVVGDIKCGDLTFDGKLKGNVHVMGNVSCKGNAVIIGDVTSTTITVESGARLQGNLQISDGNVESVELPEDFTEDKSKK